ncbi:MAG: LysR family transcriptional regulator [Pseudanabaenaceae cyanobacterium bins.68]|nr:LysR family transcriptional regulator [Pseudanabaenaceae cyanobacterium bins.68]
MKSIDISAIDLNLLTVFEALWLEQSVTLASSRLHLGQPAVSSSLARLRSLFNDDLFVRMGRDMKPTAKARSIAPQLLEALHTIRLVLENHDQFDPQTSQREFTIATSDYLGNLILPAIMAIQSNEAPQVNWRIVTLEKNSFIQDLERGDCDLAIGTFAQLPKNIQFQPFIDDSFVGICRGDHPILDNSISLESLVAFPHALFTLRKDNHGMIDRLLENHQLKRRIALTVPYWFILPNAIAHSDLLAIIPNCLACHFIQHFSIEKFDIPLDMPKNNVVMAWSAVQKGDQGQTWLREKILAISSQFN